MIAVGENALAQKASVKAVTQEYREHYKADFLKEERSPFYGKKEALESLRFYKPKNAYKVDVKFIRTKDATVFDMATYSGKTQKYVKYGTLHFTVRNKKTELAVYQSINLIQTEEYKDYLFIPFKDWTNDDSTYGGGRYMDITIPDLEKTNFQLDFNKAYNPWCAFSDGYNCPIPPTENHLSLAIKAGEKKYAKKY